MEVLFKMRTAKRDFTIRGTDIDIKKGDKIEVLESPFGIGIGIKHNGKQHEHLTSTQWLQIKLSTE